MATDCIAQLTLRYQGVRSPIVARFNVPHASSDGGLVLLKAVDERLRLTEAVAACLTDPRQPGKVAHSLRELMRQRVFGLAAGYLDGNDAARLADDPLHKLMLDREPLTGPALGRSRPSRASRTAWPTRTHPRGALSGPDRDRPPSAPAARPCPTHHDRSGSDRRSDPWPAGAHLLQRPLRHRLLLAAGRDADLRRRTHSRPGRDRPAAGQRGRRTRGHRPAARGVPGPASRLPTDIPAGPSGGGFAGPRRLGFLDRAGVEYVVGLPGNPRLDTRIRRRLGRARVLFRTTGQATAVFGETRYAAKSWGRTRRVIMKAEVVQYPGRAPRDNPRFVVSNLTLAPEAVYAVYRQRGDVENRYKELKDRLGLGRTSCPRFLANQFRVLLTATAYILFQTLQQHAQGTACAGAQVATCGSVSSSSRCGSPDRGAVWCCTCHAPIPGWAPGASSRRRSGLGPANRSAASPARVHDRGSGLIAESPVQRAACVPRQVLGRHRAGFLAASTFSRSSDAIVVFPRAVRLTSRVPS